MSNMEPKKKKKANHFKDKIIELVREGKWKDGMMKHKDLSSASMYTQ